MRRKTVLIIWVVVGVLLTALGFVAGFFLPFWNYSTTYAPVISTQPAPSTMMLNVAALPDMLDAVTANTPLT